MGSFYGMHFFTFHRGPEVAIAWIFSTASAGKWTGCNAIKFTLSHAVGTKETVLLGAPHWHNCIVSHLHTVIAMPHHVDFVQVGYWLPRLFAAAGAAARLWNRARWCCGVLRPDRNSRASEMQPLQLRAIEQICRSLRLADLVWAPGFQDFLLAQRESWESSGSPRLPELFFSSNVF